ncbi:DEAD/DEAH box helicase [Actinomyces lilanjuaniae]|uniref:DEAD/DEAH box helicase n=1 Tax=Actinomyces lilanjuaniae TaxID=2321394 RepID=A0ABN5PN84_9ACTO|nr:DEAD/DEAH box helicase [Actinomyces lilanjuaniae]AYD89791.1 DEAD/DEAH box helicase [Actinomyces lilanjuaniae]
MSSPAERYADSRRRQAALRSELARFVSTCPFPLDDFQEEACSALERGDGVLVAAPTGAGKTVVGEFAVHLGLARGLKTFYTTPIKALSNQKYLDLVERHGADRVGLLTGDTSVNPRAQVVVMTTEVLRNMLYSGSRDLDQLGYVVMDEVHYLADRFRGPVWEEVMIHLAPQVRVVSLSATVSNAEEFGAWLGEVRGSTAVVVSEHRPVPLTQHMMVGGRILPLYASSDSPDPVAYLDDNLNEDPGASGGAPTGSQPPSPSVSPKGAGEDSPQINPELLTAVDAARRATTRPDSRSLGYSSTGRAYRPRRAGGSRVPGQRRGGSVRERRRRDRAGASRAGQGQDRGYGRERSSRDRAYGRGIRHGRLSPPSRVAVVTALERARLLPAIVFVFSRAGCEQAVSQVVAAGTVLTTQSEAEQIRQVIERRTATIPSADLDVLGFHAWTHALERGVAAHHAGLLPVFKETVEELFSAGLVKVVYATETLSLGINMPARTVVLESLRKWNGSAHVPLSPGEYTQLTGRAGRRGIDVEGHAVVLAADDVEPDTVSSLASRRTYPLVSAFRPTYNMAVNLLARTSRTRAREILESSFAQFQADRSVVETAAQIRRKRRRLEDLEQAMTCSLGDFREYARLRQDIAEAEADLSRQGAAAHRAETARTMTSLSRGDVVTYRKGRRHLHGVVLEVGTDRSGTPALTVVGEDGRVHTLTPDTSPQGVLRIGRLPVDQGTDPRSTRDRERVVGRLRHALRAGELDTGRRPHRSRPGRARAHEDRANQEDAGNIAARIDQLRQQMRSHPCHGCPDREEHARTGRRWAKQLAEINRLHARVETRTGTIARLFDAVCQVLVDLGYLEPVGGQHEQLRVTGAGRLLARIYAERDLLVAECLRTGVWESLGSDELAAALSAFVYEPRVPARLVGPPVAPGSSLGQALRAQHNVARRVNDLEQLAGIEPSSGSEPALAGSVLAWCQGADLAEVMDGGELTAGDFVRWCKQVLDVVSQVASLPTLSADPARAQAVRTVSQRAAEAARELDRGVVAWSGV